MVLICGVIGSIDKSLTDKVRAGVDSTHHPGMTREYTLLFGGTNQVWLSVRSRRSEMPYVIKREDGLLLLDMTHSRVAEPSVVSMIVASPGSSNTLHVLSQMTGCLMLYADSHGTRLFRSLYMMRPIYYVMTEECLLFSSERRHIMPFSGSGSTINVVEPGQYITIAPSGVPIETRSLQRYDHTSPDPSVSQHDALSLLAGHLRTSMEVVRGDRCAVLFSGGVDSSLVAHLARDVCADVCLFCVTGRDSTDTDSSRTAAHELNLPLTQIVMEPNQVWEILPEVIHAIGSVNPMDVCISLPFAIASLHARQGGYETVISGQGPDELFAGYARHVRLYQTQGPEALQTILNREIAVTHRTNIERDEQAIAWGGCDAFFPYLYGPFIKTALSLPPAWKVSPGASPDRKVIFRRLAIYMGLPESIAMRPKRATQYSSGSMRTLLHALKLHADACRGMSLRQISQQLKTVLASIQSL